MVDYRVQGTNSSVWMFVFVRDGFADDDALVRFLVSCQRLIPMFLQLTR